MDALKMILIGAPLSEVPTRVTRLIETQRPGMHWGDILDARSGRTIKPAVARGERCPLCSVTNLEHHVHTSSI